MNMLVGMFLIDGVVGVDTGIVCHFDTFDKAERVKASYCGIVICEFFVEYRLEGSDKKGI